MDIRVAGRDMHSVSGNPSSNVNLTLNILGYSDSCGAHLKQIRQEELDARRSNIVALVLEFLRARWPFFTPLSPVEEHPVTGQSTPEPSLVVGANVAKSAGAVELKSIDEALRDTLNTAPQDVYVHTLLQERLGLPCWEPRPLDMENYPAGVLPGDVGTYTIEGGFERLFNLFADKETLCAIQKNCDDMICRDFTGSLRRTAEWMRRGDAIAYGASTEKPLKRLLERPVVDVLYEFHCHSSTGAILATPSSADKNEVKDPVAMQQFICTHAEAIYRLANSTTRIGADTSLYVMSGCIKSNSWAMAAYKDEMSPHHATLQLVSVSPPPEQGSNLEVEYRWTKQGLARARCGWDDTGLRNQSLFLRGFKLAFSPRFRSRVEGSTLGDDGSNMPGPTGPDSDCDPRDPHDNHSGSGEARGDSSGQHGTCSEYGTPAGSHNLSLALVEVLREGESAGDEELNCIPFPGKPQTPYHPSDLINSCILQQTGCDIAICHNDSWTALLETPGSSILTGSQSNDANIDVTSASGTKVADRSSWFSPHQQMTPESQRQHGSFLETSPVLLESRTPIILTLPEPNGPDAQKRMRETGFLTPAAYASTKINRRKTVE
ncbi:hypothetical protein FA13DRAFT_1776059 [Coprinellus micaceus]|uniref:Uncharacterized protein n=1 Tax=Coprinellus micaceus TaxID=71717 RepID=A0A4Y7T3K9_COPMI|nr:hypothetical protein FA13DRAFT_1776059 [Coprinellus micaceus]